MTKKLLLAGGLSLLSVGLLVLLALRDTPGIAPTGDHVNVQRDDQTLSAYRLGPSNGPVVVLVASFARSVADFNTLAQTLAEAGFQTLRVEARGIGGSSLANTRPLLFDYADDLAFVLDQLDMQAPVAVVGHAFGNRVARTLAARHPMRVKQLILLAAGDDAPPPDTRNDIFTVMTGLLPDVWRKPALQRAFFAPNNTAPQSWLQGWHPRAGLAQAHATANTPKAAWISAGNQVPVTVVQPQHDAAAARGAEVLSRLIPQRVDVVHLPNAGHAILPEQPNRVAEIVLNTLTQESRQ